MIALLLNHLWQSSLCVGGAGLTALALHRNGAHVRFWLWFAASVKFLVPFAAMTALGAYVLTPMVAPVAAPTVMLAAPLAKPFSAPAIVQITASLGVPPAQPAPLAQPALPAHPAPLADTVPAHKAAPALRTFHLDLESVLLALWAAGFLILVLRWLVRWSRVRALLREARDVQVDAPVAVKFSASRLEPGLVGILNPVILLPQGIERQLSRAELQAVLAHELCHWRRRDNLLAAIHMLVEALFWFFPLVWWLGVRLNAERERACDESVLAGGNDPQMYAEGILKVCRAYLQPPLACVAGVSGAGLKKRVEIIMENRLVLRLNAARKFVLSASAALALALPLALGLMATPVTRLPAKAAQIPVPVRTAQGITQKLPFTPQTPAAVLPASPVTENPAGALPTQEAATASAEAPPPAVPPPSLPDATSASEAAAAPNDPPAVQPQSSGSSATALALNDPPQPASQPVMAQATMAQAVAARTCELPKIADSVPLEQAPGSNLMTVPVTINGSAQNFLLDIGLKKPTAVSPELIAKLSLPEALPNVANFGGGSALGFGGPAARHDIVTVHSFGIGDATGHRLQFLITKDGEVARSASYGGYLTGAFFRQYDVELDFAGKQVNWLTPTSCADPNQVVFWAHSDVAVIPVTLAPDGRYQMQATIQGHVINAELDTSSARTVMRRDIAERYVGLKAGTPDMAAAGDLQDGRHMQVYVHTFPQLIFAEGGVTAENVPVLIQDYSMIPAIYRHIGLGTRADFERIPDLVIGMDVLSQLHMYVVPGQGKVYVTAARPPSNNAPVAAVPKDPAGVAQAAQPAAAKPTIDQLHMQQAAEARAFCTDRDQGPESRNYAECVNGYLQSHYGWRVFASPDGSLHATYVAQMPAAKGNDTTSVTPPQPGFGYVPPAHR